MSGTAEKKTYIRMETLENIEKIVITIDNKPLPMAHRIETGERTIWGDVVGKTLRIGWDNAPGSTLDTIIEAINPAKYYYDHYVQVFDDCGGLFVDGWLCLAADALDGEEKKNGLFDIRLEMIAFE